MPSGPASLNEASQASGSRTSAPDTRLRAFGVKPPRRVTVPRAASNSTTAGLGITRLRKPGIGSASWNSDEASDSDVCQRPVDHSSTPYAPGGPNLAQVCPQRMKPAAWSQLVMAAWSWGAATRSRSRPQGGAEPPTSTGPVATASMASAVS